MSKIDCTVLGIESVYKITTLSWARPIPMSRPTNGIVFFLDGEIEYNFEGNTILARKGDILIIPKGAVYSGVKKTYENSFYVVDFEIEENNILLSLSLPLKVSALDFIQIDRLFSSLLSVWNTDIGCCMLNCKSLLYELLAIIADLAHPTVSSYPYAFSKVLDYIQKNYGKGDLSVSELCAIFKISPTHLRRLFSFYLKLSPIAYIQNVRIRHAKDFLLSGIPIKEISNLCGFSSVYYFSRSFKKSVGISPKKYRESM